MRAILALEDGRTFEGISFGAAGTTTGEICFNTSMTGYQEVITDPSYRGQIVTMTYPEIGNYGINPEDDESVGIFAAGLIVSVFQAATQINEATLSFIPKLIAMFGVTILAGPWMLATMVDFMRRMIVGIPGMIG